MWKQNIFLFVLLFSVIYRECLGSTAAKAVPLKEYSVNTNTQNDKFDETLSKMPFKPEQEPERSKGSQNATNGTANTDMHGPLPNIKTKLNTNMEQLQTTKNETTSDVNNKPELEKHESKKDQLTKKEFTLDSAQQSGLQPAEDNKSKSAEEFKSGNIEHFNKSEIAQHLNKNRKQQNGAQPSNSMAIQQPKTKPTQHSDIMPTHQSETTQSKPSVDTVSTKQAGKKTTQESDSLLKLKSERKSSKQSETKTSKQYDAKQTQKSDTKTGQQFKTKAAEVSKTKLEHHSDSKVVQQSDTEHVHQSITKAIPKSVTSATLQSETKAAQIFNTSTTDHSESESAQPYTSDYTEQIKGKPTQSEPSEQSNSTLAVQTKADMTEDSMKRNTTEYKIISEAQTTTQYEHKSKGLSKTTPVNKPEPKTTETTEHSQSFGLHQNTSQVKEPIKKEASTDNSEIIRKAMHPLETLPKVTPPKVITQTTIPPDETEETYHSNIESRAAMEPPFNEGMTSHSKVALISITVITVAVVGTIFGVWYKKISFDHQRYKEHTLLADDEEELGVFNRLSYNSGRYTTYESWSQVPNMGY